MADKLTQIVRCALADLIALYYEGSLSDPAKQTLIELYEALKENGEDVSSTTKITATSLRTWTRSEPLIVPRRSRRKR